jgi:hypothetical protein
VRVRDRHPVATDDDTQSGLLTLRLRAPVTCADGAAARLDDIVVEPSSGRVTHLVIVPVHEETSGRMVPFSLAGQQDGEGVSITCTGEDLSALETVTEFAFFNAGEVPRGGASWDVGVQEHVLLPMVGEDFGLYGVSAAGPTGVSYDRIPKGEAELQQSSPVRSADGHELGHLDGVLVAGDGSLTHVLLGQGHLWRRRETRIPVAMVVAWRTDAVDLRMSRDAVDALPAVHVARTR